MAIPPPLLKPFEEELLKKWRGEEVPEMWRFGFSAVSPKSEWIKGYLKLEGASYVKQLFEEWVDFTKRALKVLRPKYSRRRRTEDTPKFKTGSYVSFRNYVRILSSLGLIKLVKTEPGPRKNLPPQFQRHFYALVPVMEKASEWKHPMQARYSSTNWANKKVFPASRKKKIRRKAKEQRRMKREH